MTSTLTRSITVSSMSPNYRLRDILPKTITSYVDSLHSSSDYYIIIKNKHLLVNMSASLISGWMSLKTRDVPAANQGSGHRALSGCLSPLHDLEMWPAAQVGLDTELSPNGCLQPVSSSVTHRNSSFLSSTTPDLTSSLESPRYFAANRHVIRHKILHQRKLIVIKLFYSAAVKRKVNYYTQSWPLSAYNVHYVCLFLFPVYKPFTCLIVCCVSTNFLTQPTYICLLSLSCS